MEEEKKKNKLVFDAVHSIFVRLVFVMTFCAIESSKVYTCHLSLGVLRVHRITFSIANRLCSLYTGDTMNRRKCHIFVIGSFLLFHMLLTSCLAINNEVHRVLSTSVPANHLTGRTRAAVNWGSVKRREKKKKKKNMMKWGARENGCLQFTACYCSLFLSFFLSFFFCSSSSLAFSWATSLDSIHRLLVSRVLSFFIRREVRLHWFSNSIYRLSMWLTV